MIDLQYLLDWATDVGGDNYRPTLSECRDVLGEVLGDTVLYRIPDSYGGSMVKLDDHSAYQYDSGILIRMWPEATKENSE